MFQLGEDWKAAGQQLAGLVASLQQVQSQTASALPGGQTAAAVAAQFQSLLSGNSSVQNLVTSMSALGGLASNTGTQIQYTKLQILTSLGIAAAEIAYALASAYWTFGASLAWIPPIEAITIAVVRALVSQLIRRLFAALAETLTWTGFKALVKEAAVQTMLGAGISMVQDWAIQEWQVTHGFRSGGIDWTQVLKTGEGAAVGGPVGAVAHGLVSKTLGESSSIAGKVFKGAVSNFGVGVVSNVAGSAASGGPLNASGIFGGAGGGAISGGVHGAVDHGGGHGQTGAPAALTDSSLKASTASVDTVGASHGAPSGGGGALVGEGLAPSTGSGGLVASAAGPRVGQSAGGPGRPPAATATF